MFAGWHHWRPLVEGVVGKIHVKVLPALVEGVEEKNVRYELGKICRDCCPNMHRESSRNGTASDPVSCVSSLRHLPNAELARMLLSVLERGQTHEV